MTAVLDPNGAAATDLAPETRLDWPRVSAIMPTRDRRPFVAQAVRYFLRQDYPDTELIVIDDGYDAVADLIPDDPRIKYVRLTSTRSIGAKRNLACAQATGEIIAHWDDDDWSAPNRVMRQVSAMLSAGADACALTRVFHYRPLCADAWMAETAIAGCSIVYRKPVWAEANFQDVNRGEDTAFVARLPAHRLLTVADPSLMVAVVHGGNVAPWSFSRPRWQPVPLDGVGALLGDDRPFYSMLRGGTAPVDRPRPATGTGITVAAAFDIYSGYGSTAEYLALSLARAGATVRAVPLGLAPAGLSDELLAMTRRSATTDDQPTIYHCWLRSDFEPFRDGGELYISTMWEADRLPPSWVPALQQARAVVVPSTFVADTCRASGVARPVVVVPLGIDPDVYNWQPRPRRDGLLTLIVAPVDERKHTYLAIEAWKAAFAHDPAARLVIKTTYGYHNYVPDDPRISYIDRVEPSRGIVDYYRDADILMALGSEGFGLPLIEGMATGLPVVALDSEGQGDICREASDLVLRVPAAGRELHDNHIVGPSGYRSAPDFDSVVGHLRWVDTHRDEARAIGRAASDWVIEHRNIWSFGAGVLDVIEQTSARTRRAIVPRTMWVPTLGTACGIAESVTRLHRNLPSVRITATEPIAATAGVVQIHHEPSIFDHRALERFTAQARTTGLTVAITEHSVFDRPSSWERNARALVTTTSAGAALLRQRHPNLRVAHIPLGCETWRLPGKTRRGRTIGFFGFPRPHKGLERLAHAARAVPGCEVVLYAHRPAAEAPELIGWPPDVPLRWEQEWLALPQIAARLAAETDVLVFHYDEVAHRSASSAALIGLSTGVPVLTSSTTWFADLGPAVHRTGTGADNLAYELARLLEDDELRESTTAAAREYCSANSWGRTAARYVDLWNSFETI